MPSAQSDDVAATREDPKRGKGAYSLYVALVASGATLGFVKSGLFASALGEDGFGYYSLSVLAASYLMYPMAMGLKSGLLRNASMLFGRGDESALRHLRNQVFTAVIATAGTVGIGFAAIGWFVAPAGAQMRLALVLAAVLAFATLLFNLMLVDVQARQRIMQLASFLALRQALTIGAALVVVGALGYPGVVLAESAVFMVLVAALIVAAPTGVRLESLRRESLRDVFQVGFPLAVDTFIRNLAMSVDRWFVAAIFGVAVLGQYSFALIALAAGLAFHALLMQVLGPRWLGEYGRHHDLSAVHRGVTRVVVPLAGALLVGSVAAWFVAPGLLLRFFPDYQQGIAILPIVWGGVCLQLVNLYHWTGVAAGRGDLLVWLSATVITTVVIICSAGAFLGAGVWFFAAAFAAGRGMELALNWGLSRRLMRAHAI